MKRQIGIIGYGNIGKCLHRRLTDLGYSPNWIIYSRQDVKNQYLIPGTSLVFLAIPSSGNGEVARDYILDAIYAGAKVITCEKAALAYQYVFLQPHMNDIKYSAAVGGGTRMLSFLRERNALGCIEEVNFVLNGTLNYIFDLIAKEKFSLQDACSFAVQNGYAEPGATDPLSIINGEISDVAKKVCIILNTEYTKNNSTTPQMIEQALTLSKADLEQLLLPGQMGRMIISINHHEVLRNRFLFGPNPSSVDYVKHFQFPVGDYIAFGGFLRKKTDYIDSSWFPTGINNAIQIIERHEHVSSSDRYVLSGPGAGAEPTVSAMITDMLEFIEEEK